MGTSRFSFSKTDNPIPQGNREKRGQRQKISGGIPFYVDAAAKVIKDQKNIPKISPGISLPMSLVSKDS